MLFNYGHYSFAIQIKRSYDETTQFCSEMHKVLQKFLQAKLWRDNTSLQKKLLNIQIGKKHLPLNFFDDFTS